MSDQNHGQQELWLVKLKSEQVKGPYSTEAICKMILEGVFFGEEHIAKYPEGEWRPISKQTEFYETILESLENPIERDEKKAQKMDAETVIRLLPVAKNLSSEGESSNSEATNEINAKFSADLQKLLNPEPSIDVLKSKNEKKLQSNFEQQQNKQFQIENQKIEDQRKLILKKLFPVLLIVVILLISLFGYYFFNSEKANTSWSLVTPNFKNADIDETELKKFKKQAIGFIQNGALDDLIKAQNLLVHAVEGKKNDMESIGLLCIVYDFLWPYTKQSSNDLKAISFVVHHARLTNPISSYSDSCQAVYLFAKGQANDSRATLEKVLDQNTESSFILYPFLNLIKGELLEELSSLLNAEAYYAEALKLFPGWVRAEYSIGRAQYKQSKYQEAIITFDGILNKHKNYKAALYGLALSLNKTKTDRNNFEIFTKGYEIKQTIPKDLNLEALQEYATLLIDRKNSKKALEVVQSALKISPTHRALKDMFISLGGESIAIEDTQVVELIIEGDQFFRLGDYLAAQARYRTAFDNDQKNTLLAIKIAKSLRALNQVRDAISWVDKAIKIDSKLFSAYALKAEYYIQRYDFTNAELTLSSVQKNSPNNYEILKSLSRLEWKKNNLNQALLYGTKAYKQFDVDAELLTLLANINIDIYFRPKRIDADDSDTEKSNALDSSQKYSARAIDLEPGWPESQITYAKYLNAKNGGQKAEKYYAELIKSFPYTVEYRLALAEFYEQQDKNNSAQEIYQRLVEADPKNIKANLGLARCLRNRNDFAAAIRYYMIGASLDPSDVEPVFSVAQLQLEMGENDTKGDKSYKLLSEALARFELVKKNNPNYPKVYYFTAKTKIAIGSYADALVDINIEKNKNPNLADPYILSAEISKKQGQYSDCAKDYSTVIKLRPLSEYYFKAAACHRLGGSLDLAEDLINEGHTKESGNFTYFREMGYLLEAKGQKSLARKNFEDYLELTAHNSIDAKEIENKILSL